MDKRIGISKGYLWKDPPFVRNLDRIFSNGYLLEDFWIFAEWWSTINGFSRIIGRNSKLFRIHLIRILT